MRILSIDPGGNTFPWMMDCIVAGHEVRWYTTHVNPHQAGYEPVKRITRWQDSMDWAKEGLVFLSDNDHYLADFDRYRRMGWCISGATMTSAQLEIDREAGMQILEKYSIPVPDYEMFETLQEALRYTMRCKDPSGLVFKTLGSEGDKSLTYVGKTPADLANKIENWIADGKVFKGKCMIQKRIDGIEVAVSGIMSPNGWIGPWEENFEHKKLLSGNYGPNTGEMGTVIHYTAQSVLADRVLKPLTDVLLGTGHTSWVDLNCIVTPKGEIRPLEFTNRPGWPAFTIAQRLMRGDPVKCIYNAAKGIDSMHVRGEVVVGVMICIPPFPGEHGTNLAKLAGVTIQGLNDKALEWCHPYPATIQPGFIQDGNLVTRGKVWKTTSEYVAVITGVGATVAEARADAYKNVKKIHLPNMIVRDDIGVSSCEVLPQLHKLGLCKDFKP